MSDVDIFLRELFQIPDTEDTRPFLAQYGVNYDKMATAVGNMLMIAEGVQRLRKGEGVIEDGSSQL